MAPGCPLQRGGAASPLPWHGAQLTAPGKAPASVLEPQTHLPGPGLGGVEGGGLAAPPPSCKDWGCAGWQGFVSKPLSAETTGATSVFWCWCANQGEHKDCHTVARGSCRLQHKAHG